MFVSSLQPAGSNQAQSITPTHLSLIGRHYSHKSQAKIQIETKVGGLAVKSITGDRLRIIDQVCCAFLVVPIIDNLL